MQVTEDLMRLALEGTFTPYIGKKQDLVVRGRIAVPAGTPSPKLRKRAAYAQQKAINELKRRQQQYERLGYEREMMTKPKQGGPSSEQIVAAVALTHVVTTDELRSKSRKRPLTLARHHVAWELRYRKHLTVVQIGDILNRDHTTITNSLQFVRRHRQDFDLHLKVVAQMLATERSE